MSAGIRRCSSGVSLGSRRSGSSAGSPTGSLPSGSRCAARCPCVRYAVTSAIAAATAWKRVLSGAGGAATGAGAGAAAPVRTAAVRWRRRWRGGRYVAVAVFLQQLDEPREAWMGRDELARAALEERAPLVRNPVRVLEVLLEQRVGVARVQSVHVVHSHRLCCTSRDPSRVGASPTSRSGCW